MSEVKRFDEYTCGVTEAEDGEYVKHSDYAKLAAEAQALRDERDSQQRVAINAMEELAALRARVVVTPALRDVSASVDPEYRASATGYNLACADMESLNGLTVSEGLLRRLCEPLLSHADYVVARNELRALLSEKEGGKP
ncbi:TPA: hypothetical protein ACIJ26_006771 [Pseudomonas aeruginosa]|nr:hypothetical protein [Pseudomonas aeruginosa]